MSTSEEPSLLQEQAELTSAPRDPLIGSLFAGKYEIERLLGTGGMSTVYAAQNLMIKHRVALKLLLTHLAKNSNAVLRFKQEAMAINQLKHKNIVGIQDFDITDGEENVPYIVMDLLDGQSLSEIIERGGPLQTDRVLHIFIQACDALAHAHSKGVIHRDLKPSNIMIVDDDGEKDVVKIVDFGIAKMLPQEGEDRLNLTQTGEIFGSPLYMSPEQCMGQKLDARSDIYSMGCILYESLSAVPPFTGGNVYDTISKHIGELPAPLAASFPKTPQVKALDSVILRAMAKDPAQRYQSMLEMKADLDALAKGQSKSLPAQIVERWRAYLIKSVPFLKRLSPRALIAMIVVAAVMAGLATWIVQTRSSTPALRRHEWANYPGPAVQQSEALWRQTEIEVKQLLTVVGSNKDTPPERMIALRNDGAVFFMKHGLYKDALQQYLTIHGDLKAAVANLPLPVRADLASNTATCLYQLRDYKAAIPWYEAAASDWRTTMSSNGSETTFYQGRINLADSFARCGLPNEALAEMEIGTAEEIEEQLAPVVRALFYSKRAELEYQLKDYPKAVEYYGLAEKAWEKAKRSDELAFVEFDKALVLEQQKQFARAESAYNDAAVRFGQLKRRKEYAVALMGKSRTQSAQGNLLGAAMSDIEAHSVWSSSR